MESHHRAFAPGSPAAPLPAALFAHCPAAPRRWRHDEQSPEANSKISFPAHTSPASETLSRRCPAPAPPRAKDRESPGVSRKRPAVRIVGRVLERHARNRRARRKPDPHPFVLVDADGERWKLELDNLSELVEVGMTKDTLKSGDRVVVSGSPS